MKIQNLFLFLAILVFTAACSDDNDEADLRAQYLGSYTGPENCGDFGNFNVTIEITDEGTDDTNEITILNLFSPGTELSAVLSGSQFQTITIPSQVTLDDLGISYNISGDGSFTKSNGTVESVDINFSISSGTNEGECSTTKTRD